MRKDKRRLNGVCVHGMSLAHECERCDDETTDGYRVFKKYTPPNVSDMVRAIQRIEIQLGYRRDEQ